MKYTVYVDDNFDYMDESNRYKLGEFEAAEDAVAAAKKIVDDFLLKEYKLEMTAAELFRQYTNFGEDPFIVPKDEQSAFSAWDYAKEQCEEVCTNLGFIDKALSRKKTEGDEVDEDVYGLLAPLFAAILKEQSELTPEEKAKRTAETVIKNLVPVVERKTTLKVSVRSNRICFGNDFSIEFKRTLRIPEDGRSYPLPPGFGEFPIYKVSGYADRVPKSWKERGGIFIPMYQREALWINFNSTIRKPKAVKVSVGKVNALTGETFNQKLSRERQDYMVSPPQEWIDGIKTGNETVRQFVAIPLGMGYTIEHQITGKEEAGGIQIVVFEPKEGKFPETEIDGEPDVLKATLGVYEMGIAAGGRIKQKIYEDEYGVETWDQENFGILNVHIVNSMTFREITGIEPPPTPITAKTYAENELPWFDVYDEDKKDIRVSDSLYTINSVGSFDEIKGFSSVQDDESVKINKESVKKIKFEYRDW